MITRCDEGYCAKGNSLLAIALVCLLLAVASLVISPLSWTRERMDVPWVATRDLVSCGDGGCASEAPIYLITPTHNYLSQMPHLVRLLWQFASIPRIVWIIIEDATKPSAHIKQMLIEEQQTLRRMNPSMSQNLQIAYRAVTTPGTPRNCRGMLARNAGLEVVFRLAENKASSSKDLLLSPGNFSTDSSLQNDGSGWVYFADDDNTYSPQLFDEIRKIQTIGVWPVGNMGKFLLSSPIVDKNGTVREFYDSWMKRKYPMDMAGFGFNLDFMKAKAAETKNQTATQYWQWQECNPGAMESVIVGKAVNSIAELQPLAINCTKVYVWHTRTTSGNIAQAPHKWLRGKSRNSLNGPTLLKEFSHVKMQPKAAYWN